MKLIALIPFLACIPIAVAREVPRVQAVKLTKPPVIDGVIDPEEWKGAPKVQGFIDSVRSQAVKDQTEAWVAYDDQAIYVAFHGHDEKPDEIVGREIKPGSEFNGEDLFAFMINPQGTRTWDGKSIFRVNVLNCQNDDIGGGRAAKREWRGEWTSAVKRVEDGWCAEFRIPWKVLNYPPGEKRSMDVNFYRYQARTSIISAWADTTVQERAELLGIWTEVSPPKISKAAKPRFLLYGAPEYDDGKLGFRSGLDVKYNFTPQFTGLASFNPDFRNIESEIAGIDFTRTERYLGEARPFFNEGNDYFGIGDWPFGFAQMFYSRRIANFDWGTKAYGQISPSLGVGALATLDTGDQTSSIVRVNKTFNSRNNLNAWYTGVERPDRSSTAYGFSLGLGRGNYGASLNMATSRDGGEKFTTAGDASVSYQIPHLFSYLQYQWIPQDFSAPLAFIPWTDKRGAYWFNEYNMQYRTGAIKSLHADWYSGYYEHFDGSHMEKGSEGGVSVVTRQDIQVGLNTHHFNFEGEVEDTNSANITFNESNRYKQLSVHHESGIRNGKNSSFTSVGGSYRLFRGFDIGANWSLFSFDGEDRLGVVTLGYEIGPLDSISGRLVSRNGDTNAYFAYRHGGGSGIEYYLIVGDPNTEKWRSRVSLKVVWAF